MIGSSTRVSRLSRRSKALFATIRETKKMKEWIPLFDIFLKSPSPETDASLWFDHNLDSSASSYTAVPINRSSFVSLLKKQCYQDSSSPANKVLLIETLPNMVQSRILSFLLFEYQRFCVSDLVWLAREMLGSGSKVVDFWVQRDAQNLLDRIPKSKFYWISHLDLDSPNDDDGIGETFDSVPDWLNEKADGTGTILPWLPVSFADGHSETLVVDSRSGKDMPQIRENMEDLQVVVVNIDDTK